MTSWTGVATSAWLTSWTGVATARLAKKVARRNLMRVLMEDMVLSVEVLVVVEIGWLDDRFEK
jgi:hypothetical protein